jgi:arsenite methyltransferase
VEIIDTQADLNAFAEGEGQSGCCSPSMTSGLPVVSCCSSDLHGGLADLLTKYNVNDFAASVKVFARK